MTIIIPVYNRANRLPYTLASLLLSQQVPLSLILVDNGSTDGSLNICQDFAACHSSTSFDIKVLEEPRRGASVARNLGLRHCQTEWVYFFDSDDLISPEFCSVVSKNLERNGQYLDVLAFPVRQIVAGTQSVRAYSPTSRPEVHILNSMLCTVAAVYRTQWLKEQGGWDENLTTWDDWEMGARVLMAKPRLQWLTKTAFHRIFVHAESQTGINYTSTMQATLQAMQTVLQDVLKADGLTQEERYHLQRALYYRAFIMAGKLACEGNTEGRKAYAQLATICLTNPTRWQSLWAWFLERYTSIGGRGAWRLALWFC